jgi:hypothetical protein
MRAQSIREEEYRKIRDAYAAQPDSESEADDWANAEEFQPEPSAGSGHRQDAKP